jgi:uncharacterized protein (TIGR03083 family)
MGQTAAMEPERHLEILRTEGERLASLPADSLDAPVPAIAGWTVERVLTHTGKVHQWTTAALAIPEGGSLADVGELPGMPRGPEALPAYRRSLDALLAAFAERDPASPAVTFLGPANVAWWLRRQANEVAVHRMDAADAIEAAGGPEPEPIDADAAADGIDEWASVFLTSWAARGDGFPADLVGRTLHLHGTDDAAPDDGAEWLLTLDRTSVRVERAHTKGDVALRGSAQDLLLAVWRRRPLSALDVIGNASVAERLLDLVRL